MRYYFKLNLFNWQFRLSKNGRLYVIKKHMDSINNEILLSCNIMDWRI